MNFGEEGKRLDYGVYLHVGELLGLQETLTQAHDELLFIVVHQAYELWFREILHELDAAREQMFGGDLWQARHYLRRVAVIERLLVQQVDVLETMSPQDFLAFRAELAPASGFQSVQFREIEFVSGLKNAGLVSRLELTEPERERLARRLAEPTLWDAFSSAHSRAGAPPLREIYLERHRHAELFDLCEALLDHDQACAAWRSRHVLMVERQIGGKTGTGGSTGAQYLRSTLDRRFFPQLWAVRSEL